MGAGKTRIVIDALVELKLICGSNECNELILIVCTKGSISAWYRQLQLWTGNTSNPITKCDICIIRGTPRKRSTLWNKVSSASDYNEKIVISIVTYDTLIRDFENETVLVPRYNHIIMDECQKYRNRKSKAFKMVARKLLPKAKTAIQISGTPSRRGPQDLWCYFNSLWPNTFRSFWKWSEMWCYLQRTDYGTEFTGVRNVENLRELLREKFVTVDEQEVAMDMPTGSRQMIFLDMNELQNKVYSEMRNNMLYEIKNGPLLVSPTILSKIIHLRQLLVCPRILGVDDDGAGLDEIIDRLDCDTHCAIFTPFIGAIPHIVNRLKVDGCSNNNIFVLQGGMEQEDVTEVIRMFEDTQGIVICSTLFAASWSLSDCKTSYMLGYDWTFDVNRQVEDRTRRVDSVDKFVTWNYMRYIDTIDDHIMDTVIDAQSNLDRMSINVDLKYRDELKTLLGDKRGGTLDTLVNRKRSKV